VASTDKDKAARAERRAKSTKAADKQWATYAKETERNAALVEAKQAAAVNARKAVKPDPQGDIDQRMAALLKDHVDMGARPK
jgi:hypothetical protein